MKKLKLILPMLAILFAIGLAFAMEKTTVISPSYYDDPSIPGIQVLTTNVDCPTTGAIPCTHNNFPLYADKQLKNPLYIRQQ